MENIVVMVSDIVSVFVIALLHLIVLMCAFAAVLAVIATAPIWCAGLMLGALMHDINRAR